MRVYSLLVMWNIWCGIGWWCCASSGTTPFSTAWTHLNWTNMLDFLKLHQWYSFLNLAINDQSTYMESNSRLPAYAKACKFYSITVNVSAISSFSQLFSFLPCSTLLAILVFLDTYNSYKQCCTWLLKVFHKCCNTDMYKILPTHPPSPSCPQESYIIMQWPNPSMLCYNILIYTHVIRSLKKITKHA